MNNDYNLTPAELRVIELMAQGYTYQQAADLLYRSVETVKSEIKSARQKTDAKNTVHLVAKLMQKKGALKGILLGLVFMIISQQVMTLNMLIRNRIPIQKVRIVRQFRRNEFAAMQQIT